jgi:hypothetical protein
VSKATSVTLVHKDPQDQLVHKAQLVHKVFKDPLVLLVQLVHKAQLVHRVFKAQLVQQVRLVNLFKLLKATQLKMIFFSIGQLLT